MRHLAVESSTRRAITLGTGTGYPVNKIAYGPFSRPGLGRGPLLKIVTESDLTGERDFDRTGMTARLRAADFFYLIYHWPYASVSPLQRPLNLLELTQYARQGSFTQLRSLLNRSINSPSLRPA